MNSSQWTHISAGQECSWPTPCSPPATTATCCGNSTRRTEGKAELQRAPVQGQQRGGPVEDQDETDAIQRTGGAGRAKCVLWTPEEENDWFPSWATPRKICDDNNIIIAQANIYWGIPCSNTNIYYILTFKCLQQYYIALLSVSLFYRWGNWDCES